MSAPTVDPKCEQIMRKLAALLAGISQAAGYYTNVAAAGIEPLTFNEGDSYPQIVVREEEAAISDANARGYAETSSFAISGFVPFTAGAAISTGLKLRDDITRRLQGIKATDLLDANDAQLVQQIGLFGNREIVASDESGEYVEVVVRVQCVYRSFLPPG